MAETSKRIIVEGTDMARVVQFPKIFAAVTAALQPPRLVLALLMVVALITVGRIWDRSTTPRVHPNGLAAGLIAERPAAELQHQEVLRQALRNWDDGEEPRPIPGEILETRPVLRRIQKVFRASTQDAELITDYRLTLEAIDRTRPRGSFEAAATHVSNSFQRMIDGVFNLSLRQSVGGAHELFVQTPVALWQNHKWFTIIFGVIFLIVFALCGGAISRIAAVQVAAQQRLRVRDAVDFALGSWWKLFGALILPPVILAIIAAVIVVMGVFMLAPVLDVIGALLYGLALILGFVVAFLILGYLAGFLLLAPAVASENCDGADAMQRAYAYVVTRPLHLLWYWLVALVGLALGFLLVSLFAWLTLTATASLFGTLHDNPSMYVAGGSESFEVERLQSYPPPRAAEVAGGWSARWAAAIIVFWQTIVITLVAAYALSYLFSAATIVYLLMRRLCDGQELNEVWQVQPLVAGGAPHSPPPTFAGAPTPPQPPV